MRLALAVPAAVGVVVPLAVWLGVQVLRWFRRPPDASNPAPEDRDDGDDWDDTADHLADGRQDGSGPNAFQAWLGGLVDGLNEAPSHSGGLDSNHGQSIHDLVQSPVDGTANGNRNTRRS